MAARIAAVLAFVLCCLLQASSPSAAPRTTRPSSPRQAIGTQATREAHVLHFGAAGRVAGPASRVSVPDGAGGLYIAWSDYRDGSFDVFVLRVTASGAPAAGWPADGVAACAAQGEQFEAVLIPGLAGGVIAGWVDYRDDLANGDGYAQFISAAGVPQWTPNGVKIVQGLGTTDAAVSSDGNGGILAAWSGSGASDKDIFAMRLDNTGAIPGSYTVAGVLVCDAAGDQVSPVVTSSGSGGAIIAWEDPRTGSGTHIFAQMLNSSGVPQWTPNGNQVDDSATGPSEPTIVTDTASGAYIFWMDSGATDFLVGQHLNPAGAEQWTHGGLGVGGSSIADGGTVAVPDASGGSILCWVESPGSVVSLRAQRLNSAGAAQWGSSGTSIVSQANASPYLDDIVAIGSGVGYFLWEDQRASSDGDIYIQHVNATGTALMTVGGVAVCSAAGTQAGATGASDGSGGLIVAWQDERNRDVDIFAQRYNSLDVAQFIANGKAAFSNTGVQIGSLVLQTDDGGSMVFWNEKKNGQYDIRARKFNSDGSAAGPSVGICTSSTNQDLNDIVDDGAGGAIVCWTDYATSDGDLYAQRVDINCVPQWTANGVPVCTATGDQRNARMICPAAGTAILAWEDQRNGAGNPDIYAQRLNTLGAAQWGANGKPACTNASPQVGAFVVTDGLGGAIISWADLRTPLSPAIYAERLNTAGDPQWTVDGNNVAAFAIGAQPRVSAMAPGTANDAIVLINDSEVNFSTQEFSTILRAQKVNSSGAGVWGATGALVCDASSNIFYDLLTGDGSGGAYAAWSDDRNGAYDIFIQRLDSGGTAQFTANGKSVCNAAGWQFLTSLIHDTGGDAYLTWHDTRGGQPDIYVQRCNLAGTFQWTANGKAVCTATRGQYFAGMSTFKTASPGRLMMSWTDNRAGTERYIFTQRLELTNGDAQWTSDGVTGTTLSLVSASAETDRVRLVWFASASVRTTVYRRTAQEEWTAIGEAASDGSGTVTFEDRDVVAGTRYAYRVGFVSDGQETFAGEVWVEVPTNLRLALDGLQPNPAVKDLWVSLTLATSAPARLEMIDVGGRRVLSRDLSALPAGRHVLRLDGARPAAGLYFIRLTQDQRTVTARATILH